MPDKLTAKEAADHRGVHPDTIRTWTDDFADHLSNSATLAPGQTRYIEKDDVQVLWAINVLRAGG